MTILDLKLFYKIIVRKQHSTVTEIDNEITEIEQKNHI